MPHLPRLALSAALAGLAALLPFAAARAQPANRAGAYASVGKSCVPEARRLCPALDAGAPQPRGMVICLRPYKSSLSLSCRHAVRAVSP